MTKIIVADSGPLIAFATLDLFALLPSIVGSVIVPKAVLSECLYIPSRPDAKIIQNAIDSGWLSIDTFEQSQELDWSPALGDGEHAAIVLAKTLCCPVLLDDKMARKVAQSMGVGVIGTAGVLIKGKQKGQITTIAPLLKKLQSNGYHFSSSLITHVLRLAGE